MYVMLLRFDVDAFRGVLLGVEGLYILMFSDLSGFV